MAEHICDCQWCVSACHQAPGRFTPIEAARAIMLGFARKLVIEWHALPHIGEVFVIRPRRKERWGACIFLKKGRCELHESGVKPFECRNYIHTMTDSEVLVTSLAILDLWKAPYADTVRSMLMAAKRMKRMLRPT